MRWLGVFVSVGIFTFGLGAVASLFSAAKSFSLSFLFADAYIRHVAFFSFYQAFLSTLLSLGFALPLSLALYRRKFFGKDLLLKLFSLSYVLPVLVAVFGIIAIYGNSGLLSSFFGLKTNIYGLKGILLAHVFFNLPLSTKVLYRRLSLIDAKNYKLAQTLSFGAKERFRYIEFPHIRSELPHLIGLVFMLCFTSFALVLALGGGVKSATIEVAIYQALMYDFDLSRGAYLALLQIAFCVILYLLLHSFAKEDKTPSSKDKNQIFFIDSPSLKLFDWVLIALCVLFLVPPLLSVFYFGLNSSFFQVLFSSELLKALGNSFKIALFSSFFSMMLSFLLIKASVFYKSRQSKKFFVIELSSTIVLITPSLVLSTGLFIMLNAYVDVFAYAFYMLVFINSLYALPFVVRELSGSFYALELKYAFLTKSLGLFGLKRLWLVELKALRLSLINAFSLSFVLSFGDLSAIALFGSPDFKTLPLLLYEQMGAYKLHQASVTALVLLLVSLGAFWVFEKTLKEKNARS